MLSESAGPDVTGKLGKLGRGPIANRCRKSNENLMANMDQLREDKNLLNEIKKARQAAEARKALLRQAASENPADMFRKDLQCPKEKSLGACPTKCAQQGFSIGGLGPLSMNKGSMAMRLRGLERNADFNHKMLQRHRAFIQKKKGASDASETNVDNGVDAPQRLDETQWRQGNENQDLAYGVADEPMETEVSVTWDSPAAVRPQSAGSKTSSQRRLQRPNSAASFFAGDYAAPRQIPPQRMQRPMSASSVSAGGILQVPEEVSSRIPLRPRSANSICDRFASIETTLRKNKAQMQADRQDIAFVKKKRQQSAKEASERMMAELAKASAESLQDGRQDVIEAAQQPKVKTRWQVQMEGKM